MMRSKYLLYVYIYVIINIRVLFNSNCVWGHVLILCLSSAIYCVLCVYKFRFFINIFEWIGREPKVIAAESKEERGGGY